MKPANGERRTANSERLAAIGERRTAGGERNPVRCSLFAVRFSPFSVLRSLISVLLAAPLAAQAPVIDHVQLVRQSVFDTDEATLWPLRLVNTLHITTLPYVIRRELLFQPGSPWDSARVAESERNLRGLRVFRGVRIDSVRSDSGLVARVTTRDGWSTRPDFRFKSTGGELDYTLALIEDNLLGTATQASLLYRNQPDRTSTTVGFGQRRLIGGRIGVSARYVDRSDGERAALSFGQPFFNLAARNSWGASVESRDERVLRYADGRLTPADSIFRDYTLYRVDAAHALRAGSDGYLRVGLAAQLRRDDYHHPLTDATLHEGSTGAIGAWVEHRSARFLRTAGYNALTQEEDLDLSTVVRLGAWLAPGGAFGNDRPGVGPEFSARTGVQLPGGFLHASVSANGLLTDGVKVDSGSVQMGATAAWLPSRRHLALVHASIGALKQPLPGSEYDLGLGAGPRGFRQHAFTGDRMYFVSAEYRYGLAPDLLKVVDVGLAAFADYGGAWFDGSPSRSGWDAGIGLRLGASRAPDVEANRIDLVYRGGNAREPAGWVLVVAKGFAFASSLRGDP